MTIHTRDPIAVVVGVDTTPGIHHRAAIHTVRVKCPYCTRIHSHAWPLDATQAGRRISPCGTPRGYRIRFPDTTITTPPAPPTRRRITRKAPQL